MLQFTREGCIAQRGAGAGDPVVLEVVIVVIVVISCGGAVVAVTGIAVERIPLVRFAPTAKRDQTNNKNKE